MTAIPAVPSEPPLTDEAALSDAELASLVELEAAATPAPWGFANGMIARGLEATGPGSYTCIQSVAEMTDVEDRMDWDAGPAYADVDPEDDAEFIVALRNAWPRLVASLRSAREEITALRGWINDTDAVLEAALGDRWSPDRPPADGVKQLAEERDRSKAAERQRALDILQIAYDALPHDSHWEAAGAALYNVQRRIRADEEGADRG